MNKKELVREITNKIRPNYGKTMTVGQSNTEVIIDAFLDVVTNNLVNGEETVLTGFGKFSPVVRQARTGRNPYTGEAMEIPETVIVKFKPSIGLKNLVKK